jgi:hypothetical protein
MSAGNTARTCPYCREEIHREARRCPHCNQWLGKAMVMVYLPVLLAMCIPLLIFLFMWPSPLFQSKPDSASIVSQIVVVDSTVHFTREEDCTYVATVGTIRNDNADVAVKDLYLEVQYFDTSGVLIDTEGAQQYGLKLLPGSEAAFRLLTRAAKPESAYANHKVFVRSAADDRFLL